MRLLILIHFHKGKVIEMKKLMIATTNAHKVEEFKAMLTPMGFNVMSLLDLQEEIDINETGTTFEENALIKARTIYEKLHLPVISDDSGLAVNAMDGAPGVYSARFMGHDTSYEVKNKVSHRGRALAKLLSYMEGK